jgi:hypothetical protein
MKAKNLIQFIENLEARKLELSILMDSIEKNGGRPIYISMDMYPEPIHKIPLYNDQKIIEFIEFQIEETNDLLELRKHEFDNL